MPRLSRTRRSYAASRKRMKASLGTASLKVVGDNWSWTYAGPNPAGWDLFASASPVSVDAMDLAYTEVGTARSAVVNLGSGTFYFGLRGYDAQGRILVRSRTYGPVTYP